MHEYLSLWYGFRLIISLFLLRSSKIIFLFCLHLSNIIIAASDSLSLIPGASKPTWIAENPAIFTLSVFDDLSSNNNVQVLFVL